MADSDIQEYIENIEEAKKQINESDSDEEIIQGLLTVLENVAQASVNFDQRLASIEAKTEEGKLAIIETDWVCPACLGGFDNRIVEEHGIFRCPWCGREMEEASRLLNTIQ